MKKDKAHWQQMATMWAKAMMTFANKTQTETARLMGMSQANLGNRFSRHSLRFSEALEMADKLGYKISFQKKTDIDYLMEEQMSEDIERFMLDFEKQYGFKE